MHIKCVFGHTKRVVLACCERVITFVPEITWRVTYVKSGGLKEVIYGIDITELPILPFFCWLAHG